jgi:hypothetical protein
MPEEKLFNIHEVVNLTGMTLTTLRNHIRIGKFKVKKKDNRYFFTQDEINKYLLNPEIKKTRANKVQSIMDGTAEEPYALKEFYNQYHELISNGGTAEQQLQYLKRHKDDLIYSIDNETRYLAELKDLLEKEDFIEFNIKF